MALSSSMYAAVTGLSALGTGMQVISNNIANVNTVGFKTMRTNYEDLISQNYYSGGKTNQKGLGVRVSTIQSMFTQGAFKSSAQDTDMAIAGEGFFTVRNAITGSLNYTRAGVFELDKDGYMVDPNQNVLQGWQLSLPKPGQPPVRIGAATDVKITVVNAPPASTTQIKFVTNLDANAEPSYLYKEHQLSFDYADEQARAYAEVARDAAILTIWNDFCEPVTENPTVKTADAMHYLTGASQGIWIPPGDIGTTYSVRVFYTSAGTIPPPPTAPSVGDLVGAPPGTAVAVNNIPSTFSVTSSYVVEFTRTSSSGYYEPARALSAGSALVTVNYKTSVDVSVEWPAATYSVRHAVSGLSVNLDPTSYTPAKTSGDIVSAKVFFERTETHTAPGGVVHTPTFTTSALVFFKLQSAFISQPVPQITSGRLINSAIVAAFTIGNDTHYNAFTDPWTSNDGPNVLTYTYYIDPPAPHPVEAGQTGRATSYYGAAPVGTSLTTAFYNSAMVDFTPTSSAVYDRNFLDTYVNYGLAGVDISNSALIWLKDQIEVNPVSALNALVVVQDLGRLDWPPQPVNKRIIETPPGSGQYIFQIGRNEVSQFNLIATELTKMDAFKYGETVYATTYAALFEAHTGIIEAFLPDWKLEGMGFAAAWDARDPNGDYIDTTGMMVEPIIIYDSLGAQHQLMIYYQKNPHMDNVWDYLITCDPLEDARKDASSNRLKDDTASFSGLIQKGKITFTGDGTDRHGGIIKDLEAQNLDLTNSKMATIDEPRRMSGTQYTMLNATVGGYYTGSPSIDRMTGHYMSDDRTYEILWGGVDQKKLDDADQMWQSAFITYVKYLDTIGDDRLEGITKVAPEDLVQENSSTTWAQAFAEDWQLSGAVRTAVPANTLPYGNVTASTNPAVQWPTGAQRPDNKDLNPATSGRTSLYWSESVPGNPPSTGFTWYGSDGSSGVVRIPDNNFAGPYNFGSGLTITFDKNDIPLSFGVPGQDGLRVTAHSEQMAWTNLTPNEQGFFDFDVAFITSASMALHPPYPDGMPSIYQTIAFDMGARNPHGLGHWQVDKEMSTTQYAGSNAKLFKGQDGHAAGSLQRVSISEDGIVTGIYTNGYQQELYQIGLTRFINPWGLHKEGDNLFSETRRSGNGVMNVAGEGGTGTVLSNFLEQSNVDIAEEIVNMILTQRGFQANSKTVTTTDEMMAEVISMKR